jgi:hypothetical protein
MTEQKLSEIEELRQQVRRLENERDRLQATVERFTQREQDRKTRVEQQRSSRRNALRTGFEKPPVPEPDISAALAERTRKLSDPAELYLDLLKNCLTRLAFGETQPIDPLTSERMPFNAQRRFEGSDWPSEAETMAGLLRLDNVQQCVVDVLRQRVPGDLVETGVWRGGITILMRAILKVYGDTERTVWAADSFAGLPVPDEEKYPADARHDFSTAAGYNVLAVSAEDVQANFTRYGLLDDRVRFLVGWFRDTLPTAPVERIAVLRLDGDLYESTMDALNALYPKVSPGGYVIVDDYYAWEPCRKGVDDYRETHDISEPIQRIDWTGAYWQRSR